MASATGNSDNTATSTAETSSNEYLKKFYKQISTESVIHLVWEMSNDWCLGCMGSRRFYIKTNSSEQLI